jgi:DNA ligase-1
LDCDLEGYSKSGSVDLNVSGTINPGTIKSPSESHKSNPKPTESHKSQSESQKSYILDAEGVAYENGKIMPFQLLSTRKRKNVDKIEIQICIFIFDILLFDNNELLHLPLSERRRILYSNINEIENRAYFASHVECSSLEDIESHFKSAIINNCEGEMIKSSESVYKPSYRTNTWIKLKKDYLDSMGDTLDLVVMGAYYGKG